jgi:hypothetical protein
MTNRREIVGWLLLIGLAPVAGWLWFVKLHTPAWNVVEAGARLTSDPLNITSRTLVVVPPKPGVVFSTVRKLGGDEEFIYLILFKYGNRVRSYGTNLVRREPPPRTLLDHSGKWGQTSAAFTLNGKPIEMFYRVELNETRTAVSKERLTIEGNYVDMRSGRVFLVDLTAEPPVYRQMKVELPAIPSKLETREDTERAAETIRRSLENQNPEIKAFCRSRSARLLTNLERTMILSTNSGDEVVNANDKQIREALSALDISRDGVGWAILARSEMTYLQVSGDKTLGFAMEYQNGDVDNHYRAARENFQLEEAAHALANYRDGRIDWSVYGDWDRITW